MSTEIRGKDELTGSNDPVHLSDNKLHIAQYVWDTNTLAWVKQTGSSGGVGSEVVVTNFPAVQSVSQSGTWNVSQASYTKRYAQESDTVGYLGEATIGSNEGSGVWRIQKLTFSAGGDVTVLWADGNGNFDNVWSDRATISYS